MKKKPPVSAEDDPEDEAPEDEAPADDDREDEAPEGVESGTGRPRWNRAHFVGGAVLGAAVLGGAGAFALGVFDSTPVPSASPTVDPSPSASLSPSGPVSYFDDGIAPGEYPVAVASRGKGYPDALAMEDWVWDRVGPEWMLALFGPDWQSSSGNAIVYLVSPEGVYFEVTSLPKNITGFPMIVSWHEEQRTARIQWDYSSEGGLLDLSDGSLDPVSFTMDSGPSETEMFLSANAANREVWAAYGSDWLDLRFFTWTASGGWSALFGSNRDVVLTWGNASNADGSKVLFEIAHPYDSGLASPRSGAAGHPNLVVYDLDTGKDTLVRPQWPDEANWCSFGGWIDDVSVSYDCWLDVTYEYRLFRVFVDGNKPVQPWEDSSDRREIIEGSVVVLDGIPLEFVSERDYIQLYEIRMVTEDGPVVVASFDDYLLRSGHPFGGVVERAPGVFRVWTLDGVVLGIDTVTGEAVSYLPGKNSAGESLNPHSYVFFGEGSLPEQGYNYGEWGD